MEILVQTPFPPECLPRVWRWIEGFRHKVADDFSPKTLGEFVDLMTGKDQRTWAIYADGELGGLVTFERLSPWAGTAHVLLKPDFQGRGIALKACRQAVAAMFALGVGKLEFSVIARNLAIGSLLANLGASREGTLRGMTLVGGQPTDVWQYGLLRKEFEAKEGEKHELFAREHKDNQFEYHADPDRTGAVALQPAQ